MFRNTASLALLGVAAVFGLITAFPDEEALEYAKFEQQYLLKKQDYFDELANTRTAQALANEFMRQNFSQQMLDHFDVTDQRTWTQQFFVKNGTTTDKAIFIFGGESPTIPGEPAFYVDQLKLHNFTGYIFELEHRFYGFLSPTGNTYLNSLRYLTQQQALADAAHFINKVIIQQYKIRNPPVIMGCSYPGALTIWFQEKYPHLSSGAVSMSSPILAQLAFPEYFEVAITYIEALYPGCYEKIGQAYTTVFGAAENNTFLFEREMGICTQTSQNVTGLQNSRLANRLWKQLSFNLGIAAQHGLSSDVSRVCVPLLAGNETAFQVLKRSIRMPSGQGCLEPCMIMVLPDWFYVKLFPWAKSWFWQKCNEFGYAKIANTTANHFHTFELKSFVQFCEQGFDTGEEAVKAAAGKTNNLNGGLDVTQLRRVLVFNGQFDPWHALSLPPREGSMDGVRSYMVPNGHHCAFSDFTARKTNEALKHWLP